jgi:hypothetical protein
MYWFLRSSPQTHIQSSMLNSNDNNENKATKAMKQLKTRNHHKSTSSKNQTKWPKQYGEGRKDKEIVEDGLY